MKNINLLSNKWTFILGLIILVGGRFLAPGNIIIFYFGLLLMIFAGIGEIRSRTKKRKDGVPTQ